MPSEMNKLAMIAHGTDGSDGIEAGVHLRWQFDRKLGFPPQGFYLFRRPACSKESICINFGDIRDEIIKLPYFHDVRYAGRNYKISLTSTLEKKIKIISKNLEGEPIRLLDITKSVKFRLPQNAQQISIHIYLGRQGKSEITAKVGDHEVEKKRVSGSGETIISLSSPNIDSILINGTNCMISKICFHVCENCEEEWGCPINGKCGFGLPVNLTSEGYQDRPIYSHMIRRSSKSPNIPMIDRCNPEWSIAACRLPKDKWCQYRGKPFDDLKGILNAMVEGAKDAPMGWRKLDYKGGQNLPDIGSRMPEFKMSVMELVLLTSIDPNIARMLGLYWVDTDAKDAVAYDYKIVAHWPQGTLWNLSACMDFEKEEIGKRFFFIFNKEGLVFFNPGVSVIHQTPSSFAQATRGLHLSSPQGSISISCTQPVSEMQLFIRHQDQSVTIEAFHKNSLVDSATLIKPEGVLAIHHREGIDSLVLKAKEITIYKICTDSEYIEHGEYSFTLCGIKKGIPAPLEAPTGLNVFPLHGMTRTQKDGSVIDHRFCAGLKWDLPKGVGGKLFSDAPILYHVQRQSPWGEIKWLTQESPVKVVPENIKNPSWPQGWPQERMFYVDSVSNKGTYKYRIAAMDIWGRISPYTDWVEVELKPTLPPPPADVEAKFLDPDDPMLSGDEKVWVTTNKKPGLKVRWKWTENFRRQAPDVNSFKVYFQTGWLNVVQGKIDAAPIENGDMLELKTDYTNSTIPVNAFAGEKLQMNQTSYSIEESKRDSNGKFILSIKKPIPKINDFATIDAGTFKITNISEVGNNLEITINYQMPAQLVTDSFVGTTVKINQKTYEIISCKTDSTNTNPIFTVAKIYPRENDFFAVPISKQVEPPAGAFINYRKASNWNHNLHTETVILPSKEQYEIIIPDPPLQPDQNNMIIHGQVGVGSVNSEGAGSVSSPATVIGVFRDKPPSVGIPDSPNMYATPANYYGKSSYAIRWNKNATLRYFVYRAMDEALFAVDAENRQLKNPQGNPLRSTNPNDYTTFLNIFDATYHDEIKNKVISPATIDYAALASDSHKNVLLKALVNLPLNEKAFAKLHERAIQPDDPKYQNKRNFWEPDSFVIDSNLLLYVDDTLDGRSNNCYFYRIRTINEIGTLGDFGMSTQPIYLPKVTPPIPPKIIGIEGGDRQITIKWSPNPEPGIAGYLLYRTDSEELSQDIRRLTLIKTNPSDTYSLNATTNPQFVDKGLEAKKKYYYRVVAVDVINENGKRFENRSEPSAIAVGQAYQPPPIAPEWNSPVRGATSVHLAWSHMTDQQLECLVERRQSGGLLWLSVSDWLPRGQYFFSDVPPNLNAGYEYRLRVRDHIGQIALSMPAVQLPDQV